MSWIATWTETLRRHLLADMAADIARLEGLIAAHRALLDDPERVRPLVGRALADAAREDPESLATALRPHLEGFVVARLQRERTLRRRKSAAVAAFVAAGGLALWQWRGDALPGTPAFASRGETSRVDSAPPVPPDPMPPVAAELPAVVVEEGAGFAFGLAGAGESDTDLAQRVRALLAPCDDLRGARVTFAVKDGWVWLRGTTTPAGRLAANQALADLGEDVLVVNQLESSGAP